MSAEILSLLSGDNDQFAQGLVALGWYDYAPTVTEQPFRGKARSLLSPTLQSAGEVGKTDAHVYRLDVPGGRWQDARAIVESQLKAEPQFAIVFSRINGELYIFVPENPDKARSGNSLISAAYIRLDAAHPKAFEDKLIQKLRGAPEDKFRAVLQSLTTVEKVTKKFYDEFKKEKDLFVTAIEGIPSTHDQKWYASVVLNRLMFIYFLQENDFLGEERNYLRAHLDKHGRYFRDFLMPLFLEGFAKREEERSPETRELLGDIPYLNGGLFLKHRLEDQYGEAITIGDDAFKRMLDFFSRYTWYIRDVPIQNEKHISPDVLGHIFEKYVNQKEMGAYYTKPDITGYICRNTIIPRLFDMLAETGDKGKNAVRPLRLPKDSKIEDYVYNAVKQTDSLPTETDREKKARRERYESILRDFHDGRIAEINDFITYNLDIEQFAQDFVDHINDAEVLRRFYFDCVKAITVLDPTCGSGAFLLTAVEILYPLYDGCLRRMKDLVERADEPRADARTMKGEFAFVNDVDVQPSFIDPNSLPDDILSDFRRELAQFAEHPLEYYIHKSIIVNNLFGVDIEEEAVEICKLRLFLKLISHAKPDASKENRGIEPLPNINFNIRAGNTLVGYASIEDIDRHWEKVEYADKTKSGTFSFEKDHSQLRIRVDHYRDRLQLFRECELGKRPLGLVTEEDLEEDRKWAQEELDKDIWRLYRKAERVPEKMSQKQFLASHMPFHWLLEFPGVLQSGGFDVVVGNPPYLDLKDLLGYRPHGFATLSTRNLYALVLERCQSLVSKPARQGYIVPVSSVATEGYAALQDILVKRRLMFSSYDDRPAHLFDGLDKNTLSIILLAEPVSEFSALSTRLHRWCAEERPALFDQLGYSRAPHCSLPGCLPKIGSAVEARIWARIFENGDRLSSFYAEMGGAEVHYSRKVNAFLQVLDFVPRVTDGTGALRPPSEFKTLSFGSEELAKSVFCCLNSTLFRWFMDVVSDGSHVNKREIDGFPFDPVTATATSGTLATLADALSHSLRSTAEEREMSYKHDTLTVQCIIPKHSKSIIDKIDRVLAKHYGFTEEELDFIINYDIKYRMGRDCADSEDDE